MKKTEPRDLEYEILKMLMDAGGHIDSRDLASEFGDVERDFKLARSNLFRSGYITQGMDWEKIYITSKGYARLSELEKIRAQDAERKKQQAFQNKVSIANVLVPLVTFILGMLTEHWSGVVNWVFSLFH